MYMELLIKMSKSVFSPLKTKSSLKLSELTLIKSIELNAYQNVMFHVYKYYDKNREIGTLEFCPETGQIGIIRLEPDYRSRGLGKQLIEITSATRRPYGNTLWAVSIPNHPFWIKQKNVIWKDQMNKIVTGPGYEFEIS